ncbi:MAG: hypothetical protein NXI20_28710 [bacterium]|nr:hypothetical protein [bacterium]
MKVLRLLFAIAVLGTTFYACAPSEDPMNEIDTTLLEEVSTDDDEDDENTPPSTPSGG